MDSKDQMGEWMAYAADMGASFEQAADGWREYIEDPAYWSERGWASLLRAVTPVQQFSYREQADAKRVIC